MSQTDLLAVSELRALQREYYAALLSEIDPANKWRLRDIMRKIEDHIHEMEPRE